MVNRKRLPPHPLHLLRIVVQLLFLLLFVALAILTARGTFIAARPWVAQVFLATDPLVLVGLALGGAFTGMLLAALGVAALSLVLPRAYCGWICPLGTTMDLVDRALFSRRDRSKNAAPRLRQVKYGLLAALLVLAVFRVGAFGWFDPICLLTRTTAVALWPMADHGAKTALVKAEEAGMAPAGRLYDWAMANRLLILDADFKEGGVGAGYGWAWAFTAILVGILAAQAYQKRFWCRNLCPLGAMLGLLGSASPLRPRIGSACTSCDACRRECKTGAFQRRKDGERYTALVQECIFCYACDLPAGRHGRRMCPVDAIHIGAGSPLPLWPEPQVVPGRRAFLGAVVTGAVLGPAFLLDQRTRGKEETNPMLRPPGAQRPDEDFTATCIRCGECMRVCPTNALHPSGIENGLAGLWTPTFRFNCGYCDYFCAVTREDVESGQTDRPANLCGTVCPTGAIAAITQREKAAWKIGTAMFDKSRCLPWARGETCLVCEEQCPLPDKAIAHGTDEVTNLDWLALSQPQRNRYEELEAKEVESALSAAEQAELDAMPPKWKSLALPYVLRDRCTGCGVCENVCPVDGASGIRVERLQTRDIRETPPARRRLQRRRGQR